MRQIDPTPCHSPVKSRNRPREYTTKAFECTATELERKERIWQHCRIDQGCHVSISIWGGRIDRYRSSRRTRKSNFCCPRATPLPSSLSSSLSELYRARGQAEEDGIHGRWVHLPSLPRAIEQKGTGRRTDKGWREIKRSTEERLRREDKD